MAIYIGNKEITDPNALSVGSKPVKEVYVGSKLVWSAGPATDAKLDVEIKAGATSLRMDTPEGFSTAQGGVTTDHPAGVRTVLGLSDASPVTIKVKNSRSSVNFTFSGDPDLKKVTLKELGAFTSLEQTFENCVSLTEFAITADTSGLTNMQEAFRNCQALASFPAMDLLSVVNMNATWEACLKLTSMPSMDYGNVEILQQTWLGCKALVCFDGDLDFSSLTNGNAAFVGCDALVQPPPVGTPVRMVVSATAGTWTNPNPCV